jgi:histidyl-tRNA synthetase
VTGADEQGAPRAPTGTHDVLWPASWRFQAMVAGFADLVERAGYGLLQSPTFEYAWVFRRGAGEGTDVVAKEMYEFADRDGKHLALRPEGTASVVRAYLQHHPALPWKAWYATPLFRHERPQAGRYRQHHQVGVEALGTADADLDVEVIWLADRFLSGLGLSRYTLRIGSMGDGSCRPAYVDELRRFLVERRDSLCDEHRSRAETSPLRVLDCKQPACRAATAEAPRLLDWLCDECAAHFARVGEGLGALSIATEVDDRLVRGFDYYTRTTFEFASGSIDAAQNALGGGGRYDDLVATLGGDPTPGIGFGIGVERVLLACDAEGVFPAAPEALDAFVVDVTGGASARDLVAELRGGGLGADRAYDGRSMKAQMKLADRSGAAVALIVGQEELAGGTVTLRPLRAPGEQRPVRRQDVVSAVRSVVAGPS